MASSPPADPSEPEVSDGSDTANASGLDRAKESLQQELAKGTPVSKAIAHTLDELIRIPGTNFRVGLDPILGLVPYGGEAVASVIGCVLLADAGRKGVPFRTLFKMSGNVIINAIGGTIPVVGDVFSAWFKSNSRNYTMLRHWLDSDDGKQAKGGWGPLLLVVGVALLVAAITIALWFAVFRLIVTVLDWIGTLFS